MTINEPNMEMDKKDLANGFSNIQDDGQILPCQMSWRSFARIESKDNFQITIDLNKASKHLEKDVPPRSQIIRHNEINVEELQINQEYSLLRPTIHRSMSKENNTSDVQKAQTNNWACECKIVIKSSQELKKKKTILKVKNTFSNNNACYNLKKR